MAIVNSMAFFASSSTASRGRMNGWTTRTTTLNYNQEGYNLVFVTFVGQQQLRLYVPPPVIYLSAKSQEKKCIPCVCVYSLCLWSIEK